MQVCRVDFGKFRTNCARFWADVESTPGRHLWTKSGQCWSMPSQLWPISSQCWSISDKTSSTSGDAGPFSVDSGPNLAVSGQMLAEVCRIRASKLVELGPNSGVGRPASIGFLAGIGACGTHSRRTPSRVHDQQAQSVAGSRETTTLVDESFRGRHQRP